MCTATKFDRSRCGPQPKRPHCPPGITKHAALPSAGRNTARVASRIEAYLPMMFGEGEARDERLDVSELLSRQLDFGHLDGGAAAMANHLLNHKLHCNCQSKTVVSNRLKIDSCNAW